jgi:hypothetical protein
MWPACVEVDVHAAPFMQVTFIDMVLLPMHKSFAELLPKAAEVMISGVEANRLLWEQLKDSGDPHAVISTSPVTPELCVFGGQAIDPMFDKCALFIA